MPDNDTKKLFFHNILNNRVLSNYLSNQYFVVFDPMVIVEYSVSSVSNQHRTVVRCWLKQRHRILNNNHLIKNNKYWLPFFINNTIRSTFYDFDHVCLRRPSQCPSTPMQPFWWRRQICRVAGDILTSLGETDVKLTNVTSNEI